MQRGLSSISIPTQAARYNFLTRQSSFSCGRTAAGRGTSVKPAAQVISVKTPKSSVSAVTHGFDCHNDDMYSTSSTKIHLSNLDKLFQNQAALPPRPPTPSPVLPSDPRAHDQYPYLNMGLLADGLANWTRRIWPEMGFIDEEMSPSPRLQQRSLMSPTQYSPKNNLGSRWKEYHGSNDWVGLLDPLDQNLRREVVRYGEFVQAAYQAFNSNPDDQASHSSTCQHPYVALPDKSYRVTKSLYATSSIGLPGVVSEVAPEWMTQRSSWIGYVAVCDDKREIDRMGRRDIVIALRGTSTCLEWAENLRDLLVSVDEEAEGEQEQQTSATNQGGQLQAKVECGFWSLYKTSGTNSSNVDVPSLSELVIEEVRRLVELYKGETLSITVTGHSLGAALSVLAAEELSRKLSNPPPIAVFSFGGPRVGNRGFANRIENKGIVKVLRVVNSQDMITKVPGMFVNEELDHKIRSIGGSKSEQTEAKAEAAAAVGSVGLGKVVLDMLDNNMPWAYCHLGSELKVDSKMSPFLKPNADVACCHDLEAYLHLVDGFIASDCPFRANAKRSLAKLLSEQESNVKKLYTSKAKAKANALNLSHLPKVAARSGDGTFQFPNCLPSPS